jgi:hypothetical protein
MDAERFFQGIIVLQEFVKEFVSVSQMQNNVHGLILLKDRMDKAAAASTASPARAAASGASGAAAAAAAVAAPLPVREGAEAKLVRSPSGSGKNGSAPAAAAPATLRSPAAAAAAATAAASPGGPGRTVAPKRTASFDASAAPGAKSAVSRVV